MNLFFYPEHLFFYPEQQSGQKNKFVCSFFGRICGSTILFRDLLTFSNTRPFEEKKLLFVFLPKSGGRLPPCTLQPYRSVPLTSLQPQRPLFRRPCLDFMVAAKAMTVERQTLSYKIQFCVDQRQTCQPQRTVSVKFSKHFISIVQMFHF